MSNRLYPFWKLILALAVLLDLTIALGPSILVGGESGSVTLLALLPIRWVVMAAGLFAFFGVMQNEPNPPRYINWVLIYFILGFTAAGSINMYRGTIL
ncbi:MAG: hypothetical protein AAFY51_03930 [Pseudomonadota bacterium]